MSDTAIWILAIAGSYLLGSIPTGLWLGRYCCGVDIRQQGSRNIGATNTLRVLGKKWGIIALIADIVKGLVPVLIARQLALGDVYLPLACGAAAILGHVFSIFLAFRGGKGVATSAGVFLGLLPIATLLAAIVFGVVVALTRIVSAASLTAAVTLAIVVFLRPTPLPLQVAVLIAVALIFFRHRTNIQRLLKGQENRFGRG